MRDGSLAPFRPRARNVEGGDGAIGRAYKSVINPGRVGVGASECPRIVHAALVQDAAFDGPAYARRSEGAERTTHTAYKAVIPAAQIDVVSGARPRRVDNARLRSLV